MEEEEDFA